MDKDVKEMIASNAEAISLQIRALMNTSNGLLLRTIGRASFLFNPEISDPDPVEGQYAHPPRLDTELL